MKKLIFLIIPLIAFGFFLTSEVKAGVEDNVFGYAWSENIGWISFNCTNQSSCGTADYGVNIDQNGKFSGYAWSENIGWIDFSPPSPYPAFPNYSAKIINGDQIVGWARALSYGDGWDGWINIDGDDYGVSIDMGNGEFSGYAWSDMVIGWINFNGTNYVVTTSFISNSPPEKPIIPAENVTWSSGCTYNMAIPTFYWEYSDEDNFPLGKDPQSSYQIRIDNDTNFETDGSGNPILDEDEFTCAGAVCLGGSSTSFSPLVSDWIDWADHSTIYYWKVRVKDSNNSWSFWSDTVSFTTPLHTYPEPDFIHTPESPSAQEEVSFTDLSTCYNSLNQPYFCNANGSNRYLWTFGDGEICDSDTNSSCRGSVIHAYSEALEYTVTLQITDNVGTCSTQGDTPINTTSPLPEYQEVPPVFFINKFLAKVFNSFKNLIFF
ncbi:MAG: PKD domain-containing protein [bacterium]